MDSFRLRLIVAEYGHDPANGERFFDAFMATHPKAGPVVSQNTETGQLTVTIAVDASDITEAVERAIPIFSDGCNASGLPLTDVLDINATLIQADELDETRELQHA